MAVKQDVIVTINIYMTAKIDILKVYHSRFDFNVNAVLHSSSDLTENGRANKCIGAASVTLSENLVHFSDDFDRRFRCIFVHLSQGVGA